MRLSTLFIALTLAPSLAGVARAQSPMAVGIEGGASHAFDESILQLGLRVTPSRGGYGAVEFGLATFPEAISNGYFLLLMDMDVTFGGPRQSSPVYFFPHGGVTFTTAGSFSGSGGGGAAIGYNLGIGVLVPASPRLGVSVDYTYRRFNGLETPWSSITFGLMFIR